MSVSTQSSSFLIQGYEERCALLSNYLSGLHSTSIVPLICSVTEQYLLYKRCTFLVLTSIPIPF
jgi:hypothetical protein